MIMEDGMKNETRYKSLNIVNNDPRVDKAFDEGEDGIWIWLKKGWTADPMGAHDVHEWKAKDAVRVFKGIVPCTCDDCANRA
jgi:hypothetical protein